MPKKNRLSGAAIRSMRSPRRFHGDLFSLSVSLGGQDTRFACVVSKKIALKATDRNTIKRRMRASLQGASSAAPFGAYVFHAKKHALDAPQKEIKECMLRLLDDVRGA